MASTSTRLLATLVAALALAGCGRAAQPLARPAVMTGATAGARSVTPDHEKVFSEDVRRATYWMPDAKLVMAIHATALNTTKISASGNVFFSAEAFQQGRTAVFVARHYGFKPIAQFQQVDDYKHVARRLGAIGSYAVRSEQAWTIAKGYVPGQPAAQHDPNQPGPAPSPATPTANRMMLSTVAFLIQPAAGDPEWNFYAGAQKFTINARTKQVLDASRRIDAGNPLNDQGDAELQRAAAAWLPLSAGQAVQRTEPRGTN